MQDKTEGDFFMKRLYLTQRCKRFATAPTSTQVAVLTWRYVTEMGTVKGLCLLNCGSERSNVESKELKNIKKFHSDTLI